MTSILIIDHLRFGGENMWYIEQFGNWFGDEQVGSADNDQSIALITMLFE